METETWIIVGINALVVAFWGGATYFRVRANSKELAANAEKITAGQTYITSMKEELWDRCSDLDAREGRHYRKILVALTALAAGGGNPKNPMDIINKMAEED